LTVCTPWLSFVSIFLLENSRRFMFEGR
jgi:hypothetical protein